MRLSVVPLGCLTVKLSVGVVLFSPLGWHMWCVDMERSLLLHVRSRSSHGLYLVGRDTGAFTGRIWFFVAKGQNTRSSVSHVRFDMSICLRGQLSNQPVYSPILFMQ